jgi:hypothetical protein
MNSENVTNIKRKRKELDWAEYARRIIRTQEEAANARLQRLHIKLARRQLTEMGWSPESTKIWLDQRFGRSGADENELE